MNAQQFAPLPGYPQQWGTKNVQNGEFAGPASYPTGGQTVNASQFGWGAFDEFAVHGMTYSGTYYCRVQYLPIDAAPTAQNQSVYQLKILWYVLATNAEVANAVDLSGEVARFFAVSI